MVKKGKLVACANLIYKRCFWWNIISDTNFASFSKAQNLKNIMFRLEHFANFKHFFGVSLGWETIILFSFFLSVAATQIYTLIVQSFVKMTFKRKDTAKHRKMPNFTKMTLHVTISLLWWRRNTQHNGTQHNGTQHNDIQHNDTQHINKNATLSIMALGTQRCYAECHLSWVSLMPSVTNRPIMLSLVMLSVMVPLCWVS